MSWLLWMILLLVIFSKMSNCGRASKHNETRWNSVPIDEFRQLEADMDRMRSRLNTVERILTDDDDRLRRDFRNI